MTDDNDDDTQSCSPSILTLHTITPKSTTATSTTTTSSTSSTFSSAPPSSLTNTNTKPPAPVAVSATHTPRTHAKDTRERSRSAPPFYKRAQYTVHNNPKQSTKTGSPTKPTFKSPQTVVIAPPVTLIGLTKKQIISNATNNNNCKDKHAAVNSKNNNVKKDDMMIVDDDSSESENSAEFNKSQHNRHSQKSNKYQNDERNKHKNKTKLTHKSHEEHHHCTHEDHNDDVSDGEDSGDPKSNLEGSDTSSEEDKASGTNSDEYDDPEPQRKKKYKKGQKKWDQKRKFDIPDYGDDDADPDSYAARVKRGLDEVYRIPQDDNEFDTAITRDTVHQMTVVGQADKKFVITRVDNTLYVVDQHAADERVRLERLEAAVGNSNAISKHILNKPQRWILAPHEIRTIQLRKAQLESWGFQWEYSPVDELSQVPTLFDTKLTMHDFREFIAQLEESRGSSLTRPNAIGRILNFKACRGAVMFGDPLSREECGVLIEQVVKCKLPFQCAHGRPSMHPLLDMNNLPDPTPPRKRRKALPPLLLTPSSS